MNCFKSVLVASASIGFLLALPVYAWEFSAQSGHVTVKHDADDDKEPELRFLVTESGAQNLYQAIGEGGAGLSRHGNNRLILDLPLRAGQPVRAISIEAPEDSNFRSEEISRDMRENGDFYDTAERREQYPFSFQNLFTDEFIASLGQLADAEPHDPIVVYIAPNMVIGEDFAPLNGGRSANLNLVEGNIIFSMGEDVGAPLDDLVPITLRQMSEEDLKKLGSGDQEKPVETGKEDAEKVNKGWRNRLGSLWTSVKGWKLFSRPRDTTKATSSKEAQATLDSYLAAFLLESFLKDDLGAEQGSPIVGQ